MPFLTDPLSYSTRPADTVGRICLCAFRTKLTGRTRLRTRWNGLSLDATMHKTNRYVKAQYDRVTLKAAVAAPTNRPSPMGPVYAVHISAVFSDRAGSASDRVRPSAAVGTPNCSDIRMTDQLKQRTNNRSFKIRQRSSRKSGVGPQDRARKTRILSFSSMTKSRQALRPENAPCYTVQQ